MIVRQITGAIARRICAWKKSEIPSNEGTLRHDPLRFAHRS